jgi:hypothetical protein
MVAAEEAADAAHEERTTGRITPSTSVTHDQTRLVNEVETSPTPRGGERP